MSQRRDWDKAAKEGIAGLHGRLAAFAAQEVDSRLAADLPRCQHGARATLLKNTQSEDGWCVLVVSDEIKTMRQLRDTGLRPYAPKYNRRIWKKGRKIRVTEFPFSPYVFLPYGDWPGALPVDGVRGILMDADLPGRIPDHAIRMLRSCEINGFQTRGRRWGELVEILKGKFAGYVAMYRGISARGRDVVRMEGIGEVELEAGDLG